MSIVFYCFRHLWRHNPQNLEITVPSFCMQHHFAMIHHLWKFHFFSSSRAYSKNRGGGHSAPPMYGVAPNRPCEVGLSGETLILRKVGYHWKFLTWQKHDFHEEMVMCKVAQDNRRNIFKKLYFLTQSYFHHMRLNFADFPNFTT